MFFDIVHRPIEKVFSFYPTDEHRWGQYFDELLRKDGITFSQQLSRHLFMGSDEKGFFIKMRYEVI